MGIYRSATEILEEVEWCRELARSAGDFEARACFENIASSFELVARQVAYLERSGHWPGSIPRLQSNDNSLSGQDS
jgi:hypothetical protein